MPSRKISAEAYLGHLKMNYSLDKKPKDTALPVIRVM